MSMIDDASDETKDAIKKARERAEHAEGPGDRAEDAEKNEGGGEAYDEDDRDTSGDVPVANLE